MPLVRWPWRYPRMTPVRFPPPPLRGLALAAGMLDCGSAGNSLASGLDASTGDTSVSGADSTAEAESGEAADGPPDADICKGVRCAAPPPCDQPCSTRCCCDRSCPSADAGTDGEAPGSDAAPSEAGSTCASASDCRLFSDMCGGCTCVALAARAPDPVCPGPSVSCFRDPCSGQSAACVNGQCAAQ